MPIRGVLDLQRRSIQIGEIRMGTSVAVDGKSYRRPVRLETWRFTSASEQAVLAAAELYGGQVAPWGQKKGRWEVITERSAIDVWVPPRGEAVDANMELWDGPRCLRRCDGITMTVPGYQPCMCPQPENPADPRSVTAARDERMRLAGLRPPQACRPLTRINVSITELPGLLGVWRLNTGSVNAAVETADSGEAMELARAGGKYIPAVLRIEWRERSADGKPFSVPVLQIGMSMRDLAQGALPAGPGGLLTQLRGGGQPKALTAGTSDIPGPERDSANERVMPPGTGASHPRSSRDSGAGEPQRCEGIGCTEHPGDDPLTDAAATEAWEQARDIYQRALTATTGRQLEACAKQAGDLGLADEHVCTDRDNDVWEPLLPALRALYEDKSGAA
jgi:hypothetical protein